MDDRHQPPPPTDAPNAGPRTLRLGDFIIEGVDRVSEEEGLSDHAIVFYNELITLMNAAGPSWQLIRKERYDKIKDVLIRIRNGEAVSNVRRDHPQCYKWSSFHALVNDGDCGFIVVVRPKAVLVCTKLFTSTCPICIQRETRLRPTPGIKPIVTRGLGTRGQVDLIDLRTGITS